MQQGMVCLPTCVGCSARRSVGLFTKCLALPCVWRRADQNFWLVVEFYMNEPGGFLLVLCVKNPTAGSHIPFTMVTPDCEFSSGVNKHFVVRSSRACQEKKRTMIGFMGKILATAALFSICVYQRYSLINGLLSIEHVVGYELELISSKSVNSLNGSIGSNSK
jgi:hypothetical protein